VRYKSTQTAGSSLLEFRGDQVVLRRVDICTDQPKYLTNALPHELTHVVLADRFIVQPIPPWADEGMAILAESAVQQASHQDNLKRSIAKQGTYRLAQLLSGDNYPTGGDRAVFYGQSASVTQFLVARGTPEKFVRFLQAATTVGYDQALSEHYKIPSVAELDSQWSQSLIGGVTTGDSRTGAFGNGPALR
jgi:hypothetical protein